jgi:hypothetical protein
VFVRAQLGRALDGDVEAWNERRQAQPVEDADADPGLSRHDSRRESPGPILDLGRDRPGGLFLASRYCWNEGITSRSVGAATLAAVTDPMVQPPDIDGSSAVPWRRVASPQVTPWPVG